jgi:hypothetical protein
MAYELIWQLNKVLFVLKSRLDGPLACLVRRLAHFPNSMLDGPTGVPLHRLVIPLLNCINVMPNKILRHGIHGIPTYLATYQRAIYAKKQAGWPPVMPGPQCGSPLC